MPTWSACSSWPIMSMQHIRPSRWVGTAAASAFPRSFDRQKFDYIKLGPYLAHLGPLNSPTTNQRMYRKLADGSFEDITSRFRK